MFVNIFPNKYLKHNCYLFLTSEEYNCYILHETKLVFSGSVGSDCDTMGCSMPGFPVLHHLPELNSNSCPWSRWYRPTISSSVVPFFSCLQWNKVSYFLKWFVHFEPPMSTTSTTCSSTTLCSCAGSELRFPGSTKWFLESSFVATSLPPQHS